MMTLIKKVPLSSAFCNFHVKLLLKTCDMQHSGALSCCQPRRLVLAEMFYSSAFLVVVSYAAS